VALPEERHVTNQIYDVSRRSLLLGALNWTSIPLVMLAFRDTPVFDPTDATLQQVVDTTPTLAGTSLPVTGKTVTVDGTAQTDPIVVPGIPVGPDVTFFVLSENTGSYATSRPILFIDDAFELPFVPNGLDLVIQPDWLSQRGWWRP
jgi:hypothetical protein